MINPGRYGRLHLIVRTRLIYNAQGIPFSIHANRPIPDALDRHHISQDLPARFPYLLQGPGHVGYRADIPDELTPGRSVIAPLIQGSDGPPVVTCRNALIPGYLSIFQPDATRQNATAP